MMLNLAPQRADRAAHLTILLSTWLYVFINMATRDFEIVSIAAVVILFIAFTWRRIMYIVITAAVTVLLISIFPFLAPVAFVIMVVIFCLRLKYIVSNWRAVLAGFYMYGVGFYFAVGRSTTVDPISALLTGFVAAVGFHLILIWLYSHQYTLERALPIMGVAPLLIILLCLPFIKAFGGFDAIHRRSRYICRYDGRHGTQRRYPRRIRCRHARPGHPLYPRLLPYGTGRHPAPR